MPCFLKMQKMDIAVFASHPLICNLILIVETETEKKQKQKGRIQRLRKNSLSNYKKILKGSTGLSDIAYKILRVV